MNDIQTEHITRLTKEQWESNNSGIRIVKLSERHDLKEKAAEWFSSKWNVPKEAYLDSIEESFSAIVPSWYLCVADDKIIAGMGVIENNIDESLNEELDPELEERLDDIDSKLEKVVDFVDDETLENDADAAAIEDELDVDVAEEESEENLDEGKACSECGNSPCTCEKELTEGRKRDLYTTIYDELDSTETGVKSGKVLNSNGNKTKYNLGDINT